MINESNKEPLKSSGMNEHFNFFIKSIPDHLEIAKKWLDKEKLSYSYKEIDEVGKIYKKLFKKSKKKGKWYDEKYEVFITYCGEAWIKYFFGKWELNTYKKTYGYGNPMVMNYGPKDYHWSALDFERWLRYIEEGDKDALSLPYSRTVNYFYKTPEWEFDPLKNLNDE